jgi:hypothetical protein
VPAFKGIDMPAACSYHVLIIVLGPFPAVLPAFPACAGVAGGSLRHFLEDANDFKMQQLCINDHPRSPGMWQHGASTYEMATNTHLFALFVGRCSGCG